MHIDSEKIKEFIKKNNNKFYQSIKLDNEVEIKGNYKTYEMYDKIGFPIDFNGKTFLDIGSNLGAFCIEAHKRGCKNGYGLEKNIYHVFIILPKIIELSLYFCYNDLIFIQKNS